MQIARPSCKPITRTGNRDGDGLPSRSAVALSAPGPQLSPPEATQTSGCVRVVTGGTVHPAARPGRVPVRADCVPKPRVLRGTIPVVATGAELSHPGRTPLGRPVAAAAAFGQHRRVFGALPTVARGTALAAVIVATPTRLGRGAVEDWRGPALPPEPKLRCPTTCFHFDSRPLRPEALEPQVIEAFPVLEGPDPSAVKSRRRGRLGFDHQPGRIPCGAVAFGRAQHVEVGAGCSRAGRERQRTEEQQDLLHHVSTKPPPRPAAKASAARAPSTAALTMPPAYPAPSPRG